MAYPDETYPDPPDFPTGYDWLAPGDEAYQVIASYIEDITTDAIRLLDNDGNIILYSGKGIGWEDTIKIILSGGEIQIMDLQLSAHLTAEDAEITTLETATLEAKQDLTISTGLTVSGTVSNGSAPAVRVWHELSEEDEPDDPADNCAVIWLSSGVGYGDQGDLCAKITEGGGTTDFTIVDFSGL